MKCGGLKVNLNKSKTKMSDGNHGFAEKCSRLHCSVSERCVAEILFSVQNVLVWFIKMLWCERLWLQNIALFYGVQWRKQNDK